MDFRELRPAEVALLTRSSSIDGRLLMRYSIIYLLMERVLDGYCDVNKDIKLTYLRRGKNFDNFSPRSFEKPFIDILKKDTTTVYSVKSILEKVRGEIPAEEFLKENVKSNPYLEKYISSSFFDKFSSKLKLTEEGRLLVSDAIAFLKERQFAYQSSMTQESKMKIVAEMGSFVVLLPIFDEELLPQFSKLLKNKRVQEGDEEEIDFDTYFDEEPTYKGSLHDMYISGGNDEGSSSNDDGGEGA
ncbi:hypothetical protein [Flammeovirga kamogawensis]|uniref:DUF4194 domain-containing protein n=1 Tax=Flammeovirga kamogawensis TaxID=373891 RepID=A0ABX8GUZ9_9BACT|nr:hypothetical protein [Flammeovirga kamogawensis]MBB6459710.1 hypothetical protein [Flammeovirga kamogawensis]QWG07229.1 hypothetical protein KM029_18290 [Flammeovirga kamogawensis]TRX69048.1 hypothetical protein EO216_13280 [Flammeovirga kamogawensis]